METRIMEQNILNTIKTELINGYKEKQHPFRFFTLATFNGESLRQRTVVLRNILDDFTLLFYTDARTPKVTSIQNNSTVSALFYNPNSMIQLQLVGNARLIKDEEKLTALWNEIGEHSKKDYITQLAPGSSIKNPNHVSYNIDKHHFCAVEVIANTIEYLQLKRPNHLRILYKKDESNNWLGQFLTP